MNKIWAFLTSGVNWYKTLLFNIRMLPFKEAVRLPIWLYGKVDINRCTGKIIWNFSCKPHFGGWAIGQNDCLINGVGVYYDATRLAIEGTLELGEHGRISNGCRIFVKKGAIVRIGDRFYMNEHCRLGSYIEINIGEGTRISWDSQIFDTDFHYILLDEDVIYANRRRISIGNYVWIGNHVTISKGAGIGDFSIVASNSLLNKDFSNVSKGLFAGSPAVLKKENCERIWDFGSEIDAFFETHRDSKSCSLREITTIDRTTWDMLIQGREERCMRFNTQKDKNC